LFLIEFAKEAGRKSGMTKSKQRQSTDGMRMRTARNLVRSILKLSVRSYTYKELAQSLDIQYKTAQRCVNAIEALGIPVYLSEMEMEVNVPLRRYRIDRDWAVKMLKVNPDAEV
jgi:vacuolar-type H+-ATPase subunit D/Vma8